MEHYTETAPAKINLFLHLTGQRPDGYHDLDSLVVFASDICDTLHYMPGPEPLAFKVTGPFADVTPTDSSNLVIKAMTRLEIPLTGQLVLEKHLPVGAGIGGGSSDAAAALRLFAKIYDIKNQNMLMDVAAGLGADVPVCLHASAGFVQGRGEDISPVSLQPRCPVVLVNPLIPLETPAVFKARRGNFHSQLTECAPPEYQKDFYRWLQGFDNGLTSAAISLCPEIEDILRALKDTEDCRLARMSGSGATCFALFENTQAADNAATHLTKQHPDWWVRSGALN